MRHVSKFMVSVAAITAISATAMASALAYNDLGEAEATASQDYITVSFDAVDALSSGGGSQTLLVLDTELTDEWDESNIKYIDQNDEGDITSFVLPSDAEGTYYIYVGGNGEVWSGSVEIGEETGDTVDVLIGDVDADTFVTFDDGMLIIQKYLNIIDPEEQEYYCIGETFGERESSDGETISYIIGDVDQDQFLTFDDGMLVIQKFLNIIDPEEQEYYCIGETTSVTLPSGVVLPPFEE